MKSLFYFLIILFYSFVCQGQYWGVNTTSAFTNEAIDVETDQFGNQYVAGYITGETSFNINTVQPTAAGNGDVYVAKYSPNGSLLWIKQFGGNYSDKPTDLALDNSNNIYITGQYFGLVNFDTYTLNSSSNSKDIFLLKLTNNGDVLWAISEGGAGNENAYGITCDNLNNLILVGQFEGLSTLGLSNYTSTIDPLTGLNSYDLFVTKYDSNGTPLWTQNGQADYEDRLLAVSCDDQNNIFFTGQFSDTLLFGGSTFNNIGYNIGFVAKMAPNGQLLWLNKLKAGVVIPYDLEVNDINEVVITGDYTGNLVYQTSTASQNISNNFLKKIFALKITNDGNYIWSNTLGSDNEISARSISIDVAKNSYITGYFKCNLSQLHDTNTAIFNSVGFKDIYLMKLDYQGNMEYTKQIGGKENDEGHGVAILQSNMPTICGSYTQNLNLPVDYSGSTFSNNQNNFNLNSYSGINYLYFLGDLSRNSFLTNSIHINTPNYNFFSINTTDSLNGVIELGIDTIHFCVNTILDWYSMTSSSIGPSYNYGWNTGGTSNQLGINQSGTYSIFVERKDACSFGQDTIVALHHALPLLPLMSDSSGIAINEPGSFYEQYNFCAPDTVEIWFEDLCTNCDITISTSYNQILFSDTLPHNYFSEGNHLVTIQDSFCTNEGIFNINLDYVIPFDTIDPYFHFVQDTDDNDSITICANTTLSLHIYDYISNPDTTFQQFPNQPVVGESLIISPSISYTHPQNYVYTYNPINSGWYVFYHSISIGYNNLCGLDTLSYFDKDSIYIFINPLPSINALITADNLLCPNGSAYLTVNNVIPGFSWSGPGIAWISTNNDSIQVTQAGFHTYSGTLTDSITGCQKYFSFSHNLQLKQPPSIIMNPTDGIICPYDSVTFWLPNTYLSYDWIGPDGYSISSTNTASDADQGFYYCTVLDDEGCYLTTTPAEIKEFTTPYLTVEPFNVICPNQTATISVTYDGNAQIQWISPISSTATQLTVNQPGNYICQIQQCGMTFLDSIEIIDGAFNVTLSASDTLLCFNENSLLTTNPGYSEYNWSNGDVGSSIISISEPGSYYVTVINQYGCEATSPALIINDVSSSVLPIVSNLTVCFGADATFSTLNNSIVNWYDLDSVLISAGNTLTINDVIEDTSFMASYIIPECPNAYVLATISIMDSLPTFQIEGDTLLCPNEQVIFTINTNSESVNWLINGTPYGNSNVLNFIASSNGPDIQYIEAIVANACYSDTFQISVYTSPTEEINLPFDSLIICNYSTIPIVPGGNYDSLFWSVGNGIVTLDTFYLTSQIGNGILTVVGIDTLGCSTTSDTLTYISSQLSYSIYEQLGNSCLNDSITLGVITSSDSLLWATPFGLFDTTELNLEINSTTIGWYTLSLWDTIGCYYEDSILIGSNQLPSFSLSNDTLICLNDWLGNLNFADSLSISWQGYGVIDSLPVISNAWYVVTATTSFGCQYTDSIYIVAVDCSNDLPNVITANNDGINDFFIIDEAPIFPNNQLFIFNRWGNKIFEMNGYDNSFGGIDIQDGTYFYIFNYDTTSSNSISKNGNITIIH